MAKQELPEYHGADQVYRATCTCVERSGVYDEIGYRSTTQYTHVSLHNTHSTHVRRERFCAPLVLGENRFAFLSKERKVIVVKFTLFLVSVPWLNPAPALIEVQPAPATRRASTTATGSRSKVSSQILLYGHKHLSFVPAVSPHQRSLTAMGRRPNSICLMLAAGITGAGKAQHTIES